MSHKLSFSIMLSALSFAGASFAFNPDDPIGWEETTSFPASVTQNTGVYSATFTLKDQMGVSAYYLASVTTNQSNAFSIGSNNCGSASSLLSNGSTCEVQVNMDTSKLATGTATVQLNPSFAVFNVLVPKTANSITVNKSPSVNPPSPPNTSGADYIMWSLPASVISYPVYVYEADYPVVHHSSLVQVGYVSSSAAQSFLGSYPSGVKGKIFSLYYATGGGSYATCNVVFNNDADATLNTSATTCPGAVINPPKASSSNVYTLALGATAFPSTGTPTLPTIPQYANRGIVFKNSTLYFKIRVQGTCADLPACSSGYSGLLWNGAGSSTTTQTASISVGNNALTSAAFYVTAFCTGANDTQCPNDLSGANWVVTGGYNADNAGYAYATKIEFTFLGVSGTTRLAALQILTHLPLMALIWQ